MIQSEVDEVGKVPELWSIDQQKNSNLYITHYIQTKFEKYMQYMKVK